jgi:uncharacterized protein involved in outer membrane biogenesis
MKIFKRLLLFFGFVAVAALGIAYFSLNTLVKKGVETGGRTFAKVETRLGSASILPFIGSGSLKKLHIGNPEGYKTPYAIQIDAVKIGVDLPSLKEETITIDYVTVEAPDIYLEGGFTGRNNLTAIANNFKTPPAKTTATARPTGAANTDEQAEPTNSKATKEESKKVLVKKLLITGAKVRWVSNTTLGQEVSLPLPDISLTDIGEKSHGVTMAELTQRVMNEVLKAASSVSTKDAGKAVELLKTTGSKNLDKATGGLKGLLSN